MFIHDWFKSDLGSVSGLFRVSLGLFGVGLCLI